MKIPSLGYTPRERPGGGLPAFADWLLCVLIIVKRKLEIGPNDRDMRIYCFSIFRTINVRFPSTNIKEKFITHFGNKFSFSSIYVNLGWMTDKIFPNFVFWYI